MDARVKPAHDANGGRVFFPSPLAGAEGEG
jgi:hypothetical protein